jgi:hypothetical protein
MQSTRVAKITAGFSWGVDNIRGKPPSFQPAKDKAKDGKRKFAGEVESGVIGPGPQPAT